jgi:hypothetical protein
MSRSVRYPVPGPIAPAVQQPQIIRPRAAVTGTQFPQTLTATVTSTSTVSRQIAKTIAGTATSTVTVVRQAGKTVAATATSTAAIVRQADQDACGHGYEHGHDAHAEDRAADHRRDSHVGRDNQPAGWEARHRNCDEHCRDHAERRENGCGHCDVNGRLAASEHR